MLIELKCLAMFGYVAISIKVIIKLEVSIKVFVSEGFDMVLRITIMTELSE